MQQIVVFIFAGCSAAKHHAGTLCGELWPFEESKGQLGGGARRLHLLNLHFSAFCLASVPVSVKNLFPFRFLPQM